MSNPSDEITPFPATDANSDTMLRECTADAKALHRLFDLPPVVRNLETEFAMTMTARADRLFELSDKSLWHVEWQSSRDPAMFNRMINYWALVRNKIDPEVRIRQHVVTIGRAPANWIVEDWIGDTRVRIPVIDFRRLDVSPLFAEGNASDMMIGILGKDGASPENLTKVVTTIGQASKADRDRLVSMFGRMIELRGEPVRLPLGVQAMIEAMDIDYERNPVFRKPYEVGRMAEKREHAIRMLGIIHPTMRAEHERLVGALPDSKIQELVDVATALLTERNERNQSRLDELLSTGPR